MRRHMVINILLVIAGIVLALALFGAGAMWKGRIPEKAPRTSMHDVRVATPEQFAGELVLVPDLMVWSVNGRAERFCKQPGCFWRSI